MKKDAPLVVVIDGQGGMIGRKLCDQLLEGKPDLSLLALGTNSAATSAMLKGKGRRPQWFRYRVEYDYRLRWSRRLYR